MITDFRHVIPRLQQRIEGLGRSVVRDSEEITGWRMHRGDVDDGASPARDDSSWDALESWDGTDAPSWFRARVTVPERFDGAPVSLSLKVGGYLHSLFNAEALAFVDGELVQGLDAYHHDIPVAEHAEGGREYLVALYVFWKPDFKKTDWQPTSIRPHPDLEPGTEVQLIDRAAEAFYWDAATAYDVALTLPEDSVDRVRILSALDRAIVQVDFREPGSDAFYDSIPPAAQQLGFDLYESAFSPPAPAAIAVGQTHIDLAWFWPLDVNRFKIGRSVATVLDLMERYPEFTFMQNQGKVYDYFRRDFPELYEAVRRRIAEGRWEVNGAMWTEPDCNMPSGESLVRQLTFGLRFFEREFGGSGDALIVMDAFGYSWALPQLLRRCGLKHFLTNKMSWNQFNRLPYDSFIWKGIDGSTVVAHQLTAKSPGRDGWTTTCNAVLDAQTLAETWAMYQQKDQADRVLFTYGYGDGGGGPTTQMLETGRRIRQLGVPVALEHGTVQGYMDELQRTLESGPHHVWATELYLELHRGTYTSKGTIKRGNRKGEVALHDSELYSAMAHVLAGSEYPREALYEAWDLLLVNQQHDILPGSITREPEEDAIRDYARVQELAAGMIGDATRAVAESIDTDGDALVVFNPVSWRRDGIVEVDADALPDGERLLDLDGRAVPHQATGDGRLLVQVGGVPSCGYTTLRVEPGEAREESSLSVSETVMENRFFLMELDDNGQIAYLYDKRADRQVLAPGAAGNVLQLFEDLPLNYDAWDIDRYFEDKAWQIDSVESVRVTETGPVRGTVEITRSFSRSTIVQRLHIYDSIPRVDFHTGVDWHETHTLLKAAFPVAVNASRATFEIQFGTIDRPTHRNTSWDQAQFEVCAQKWADLSEGDYGVSLLNDCKYGYDVEGSTMRISLLRSPTKPDPLTDQGSHEFTYSLMPHSGDWRNGSTRAGYELNYPMTAVRVTKELPQSASGEPQPGKSVRPEPVEGQFSSRAHSGRLPMETSLVAPDREGLFVDTIKLAEDDDRLVVRCYEGHNTRGPARLRFGVPTATAREIDLLERDEGPASLSDSTLTFDIAPYEVRTFAVEV